MKKSARQTTVEYCEHLIPCHLSDIFIKNYHVHDLIDIRGLFGSICLSANNLSNTGDIKLIFYMSKYWPKCVLILEAGHWGFVLSHIFWCLFTPYSLYPLHM